LTIEKPRCYLILITGCYKNKRNVGYNQPNDLAIGKDKWEPIDAAELVSNFETRVQTISQRDFAEMADVPRSTLRYWLARKNSIDAHPALIEFFGLDHNITSHHHW